MDFLKITYKFESDPKNPLRYELLFDPKTMLIVNPNPVQSHWTALDHCQCDNCPWKKEDHPHCPVAQNLVRVASAFAEHKSHKEMNVIVFTTERTYGKKVDLQTGLQGIFGLIMATSGCPHMNFLKPMARFHLPFATHTETILRSTSFYLLQQFFNFKDGKEADWAMKDLEHKYKEILGLNQGIIRRIRDISAGDADQNAIIILDTFANLLTMEIQDNLTELKTALTFID